jgi:N-acetylglucosaminyldiphosphoundecaprenol N-acetyl-beta-D-mannosaminyltransferase
VIASLEHRLKATLPSLAIVGMLSPPYRQQTEEEDQRTIDAINDSGAAIVLIGLGCPKQEIWMAQHRGRIHAVMIGVGLAFDQHARTKKRAPAWMQDNGLEWLYRLTQEPRRLWRRYLITNTIFIARVVRALLRRNQAEMFPVITRE